MFVAASGLLSTSIALRAAEMGLPASLIGLMMAGYFLGFIIGTYVCPRVIVAVGHIRSFSVFAAVAAAAAILHALFYDFLIWAVLRIAAGICLAGLFMVVESWLNEQSPNSIRGRVFAAYQIISLSSIAVGQWLLPVMSAQPIAPFLICGLLLALGLVPTSLARVTEPAPVARVKLDLPHLWSVSPLSVLGAFTAAIANSVFFALGPIFGDTSGMGLGQIAAFMSLVVLGGVALQWPIGHLSDRFDRRGIILAVSVTAAALAGCAVVSRDQWLSLFYLSAFLYGGFTFSIYPLCVAHSNDHAQPEDFIKTASGLLLVYGVGATLGPPLAGLAMGQFGADAFFQVLMIAYAGMSFFIVYRIAVRPRSPGERREPFVMLNRTSQSALGMLAGPDDRGVGDADRGSAEKAGM